MPAVKPRLSQPEFDALPPMQKIEATFGANMPAMYELASVPWDVADLHERALKVRLFEVYIRAGLKFADLETRKSMGAALLEGLQAALDARRPKDATD